MGHRQGAGSSAFAARAFALIHPYWSRSGERGSAWALLLSIVAISLGLVYLNVRYNYWNRSFFNALEAKDFGAFWTLIPYFFALSALTVAGGALQAYLTQMLQMRWRIWMTREYLTAWLDEQSYYRLEQDPRGTDNPDQRMTEDLKGLAASTLELAMGFLHNGVTLVTFIAILWSVSGSFALPFTLPFTGERLSVPGDMVWAALAYAAIGSAFTYVVGRPLIGLRFQQERLEADMRYSLMRTREHAEGIALYGGEPAERRQIEKRIDGLNDNWWQIMGSTMKLNGVSSAYTQIGILFPYFIAAPRYFSGSLPLGGLTQIAGAFDTVRTALSWFVYNYQALASWKASVDRLLTFDAAVAATAASARRADGIRREPRDGDGATALGLENLSIAVPGGAAIVRAASLEIGVGERVLLTGEAGAGKSTLFRAIAGLWPYGSGRIGLPAAARLLFLPQKPYLPAGRLADVVAYPSLPGTIPDAQIREAMQAAGLAGWAGHLDDARSWGQTLSGGEQQKLAVARAIVNAPDWLFLDEATAALDAASEAAAYRLLIERLPRSTIVSIAHRPELRAFHTRILEISGGSLQPIAAGESAGAGHAVGGAG